MSSDNFLDRIRAEAQPLRYEPQQATFTRLSARIRAAVAAQPTVSQLLATWFRPVFASLVAIALAASFGLTWYEHAHEQLTVDQISTRTASIDGDVYGVGE